MNNGLIVVISGPSGVGKGTVIAELLKTGGYLSVSATTRAPRPGEIDGVHYAFVTADRFREMISRDEFLEYAEYVSCSYGTPAGPVDEQTAKGVDVYLDIETEGAMNIRARRPEAVLIYLAPPSMAELERRLRGRGTETEEKIQSRLAKAKEELELAPRYDYLVQNITVEQAAEEIAAILAAERLRTHRRTALIDTLKQETL